MARVALEPSHPQPRSTTNQSQPNPTALAPCAQRCRLHVQAPGHQPACCQVGVTCPAHIACAAPWHECLDPGSIIGVAPHGAACVSRPAGLCATITLSNTHGPAPSRPFSIINNSPLYCNSRYCVPNTLPPCTTSTTAIYGWQTQVGGQPGAGLQSVLLVPLGRPGCVSRHLCCGCFQGMCSRGLRPAARPRPPPPTPRCITSQCKKNNVQYCS